MNSLSTWFQQRLSLDLRSLALFRMVLGGVLIADLFIRSADLVAHYTDFGLMPRSVLLGEYAQAWHFSFHLISGSAWFQALLFFVAGLAALSLMLGYRTRFMTVVSWILLISLHARNGLIIQGGDVLLRMLLFWAMFLPLGARYSVDQALSGEAPRKEVAFFSAGTVALYIQMALCYWFSVLYKTGAEWWEEGSALYYALNLDHFVTGFGSKMLAWLPYEALQGFTWSTLAIEIFGPLLILFSPVSKAWRFVGIVLLFLMHLGFSAFLEIGIFTAIGVLMMTAFFPSWFWQGADKSKGVKAYYDGDCGFCRKGVALLKTFMGMPQMKCLPAQSQKTMQRLMKKERSWVVVEGRKKPQIGFAGFLVILKRSPLFWWLAPLLSTPPCRRIGEAFYRWVADHRGRLGWWMAQLKPAPVSLKTTRLGAIVATFCLVYIALWNLSDVGKSPLKLPTGTAWIGHTFQLGQQWNMFSPHPPKDDGWFVIPGKLQGGTVIDLFTGKIPPEYSKPERASALFTSDRWRKYFRNISSVQQEDARLHFGRYVCRNWNADHEGSQQLSTFQIYFMKEVTQPDYAEQPVKKELLWDHKCF